MHPNPFSSPQPVEDEVHVVKRGRTLLRTIAAVVCWLLAVAWTVIGAMAMIGAPPGIWSMAYTYATILFAIFASPVVGLVFLGLGSWRASRRMCLYGLAAFTPFAALVCFRAFFWD